MVMVMIVSGRDIPTRSPKHPDGHARNDDSRDQLKVRFRFLGVDLVAIIDSRHGNEPDEQRMGDSRGKTQQYGLGDRPPNRDNEGRHHGLGMARLEPVQRSQEDGAGDKQPGVS